MLKVIGGVSYITSAVHGWSIKLENVDEVKIVKRNLGQPATFIEVTYGRKVLYVGGQEFKDSIEWYERETGKPFKSDYDFLDLELYEWLHTNFCTKNILY